MTAQRAWTRERHEAALAHVTALQNRDWSLQVLGHTLRVVDAADNDVLLLGDFRQTLPELAGVAVVQAVNDLPDALAEIEQLRRELDTALLQLGEAQREVTRITAVTWSMGCALGFYANVLNYRERFDAYGQWTSDIQEDAGEIARNALAAAAPGAAS